METQVAVGDDAEGPSAEPADLVGGCIASRYALSAVLGRGGMATVYAARDLAQDGRAVALKLMRREMAERSTLRRRFQNEAYVMMTIVDPHVVEVIDMGVHDDGTPFYVMERLEGQSLEAFATGARFAAARVVEIGTQICAGLETAHARGVIHRDLKPENVFVAGGAYLADPCCVKVLDFGLAKVPMGEVLTVPGSVFGTPRYMSPEQAVPGRPVDRRTDIYSLGVILYELLCGDVPFPAVDAMQVMLAHVGKAPTPVAERRPDIPTPLAAVVDRCLDKRPAKRFATMAELRTALQRSIAGDVDGAPAIEVARASVMPRVDRTVIVDHGQLAVTVDELVEALPASADPAVASANGPPTMTVDGSPKDAGASIEGAAAAGASTEGATTAGASTAGAATGRGGRLPTPPGPEPWRPPLRADPWSAWVTLSCVVLVPVVAAAVYFGIV